MEFFPQLIGDVSNAHDLLPAYRELHRRWETAAHAIVYSRSYRDGLDFVDRCERLNDYFWDSEQIDYEEFERFDANVILLRLTMLDKLDWWDDYIRYFEQMRAERDYETTLCVNQNTKSYILRTDGNQIYNHFLAIHSHRFELIKRKLHKLRHGGKTGNLMHRKQSELTEEEIERRFKEGLSIRGLSVYVYF